MQIPTVFDNAPLSIVMILTVIIATLIITRIVAFFLNRMHKLKEDMTAIYLIRDIIIYVIYFIALMIVGLSSF